jgi:GMP synthase (glutamine-hydrolysing)
MNQLRYLLLQIRSQSDPMREQEVRCFSRALECELSDIVSFDLLAGVPTERELGQVDAVLIGGSGDYSAADDNPWLERTLAGLKRIVDTRKPTFASCWGFQAFSRAAGGRCTHDPQHAELGTIQLRLTEAGRSDPLFGALPNPFRGQAGHEDHVVELPPGAVLLASSELVTNQAFKFADAPIYCTQFHPELDRQSILERAKTYPRYVQSIAGKTIEQFAHDCCDTPETQALLPRFARLVATLRQNR